jgi:hypothetical protein
VANCAGVPNSPPPTGKLRTRLGAGAALALKPTNP